VLATIDDWAVPYVNEAEEKLSPEVTSDPYASDAGG